jgi:hypothetical protein
VGARSVREVFRSAAESPASASAADHRSLLHSVADAAVSRLLRELEEVMGRRGVERRRAVVGAGVGIVVAVGRTGKRVIG